MQVSVGYEKRRQDNFVITPSREQDVKSLARRSWQPVIRRSMKDPSRQLYIVNCVARLVKYEMQRFCSTNILAGNNVGRVQQYQWKHVIAEAEKCMPVFMKLLRKCLETPTERGNITSVTGMIIAILAKHRRPQLCYFQKIVSLLLYSGRCSKKVSR